MSCTFDLEKYFSIFSVSSLVGEKWHLVNSSWVCLELMAACRFVLPYDTQFNLNLLLLVVSQQWFSIFQKNMEKSLVWK